MALLDGQHLIASFYTLSGAPVFEPARHPFADRVAAAAAAGFTGIGITPDDVDATLAAGLSRADLRAILTEHGVAIAELEGTGEWYLLDERGAASRREEERLHALADLFGPCQMNVGVIGDAGAQLPRETMIERFAALCDRAAPYGIVVVLEPLVIGTLQTVAEAVAIVAGAARRNGGVLIDSYHVFRGPEALQEALAPVTPEHVMAIQLGDALAQPRGSIYEDCCNHRVVPGEGELALVDLLVGLDRAGLDLPIAIELMSAELRALPIDEAARRVAAQTRAVLAAARVASGLGAGS